MPWDWDDPCTSVQLSQAGGPIRDRETLWTEGNRNPGKLQWRVYPLNLVEGRERILKKENLEDVKGLPISGFPAPWRSSLLLLSLSVSPIKTFHFVSATKLSHFSCLLILYLVEKRNLYA
jgi:hypothetical protein